MMPAHPFTRRAIPAALALCFAHVAFAQNAPAPAAAPAKPAAPLSSGAEPPTVVISVTQVEQPAFDLPASVDVITGPQLRDGQRGVNLSETLNRVPGLQIMDRQNYAQDLQISSRGFGARSQFGIRGIRLYADGIPATQPDGQGQTSHFSLSSASRVEVLRGPFSALYGNSAGGVISIYTEDGGPGFSLKPSFSVGSYDAWRIGMQASGSTESGKGSYLIDASKFSIHGYRDHDAATRELENAKLKSQLDENTTLTWTVNRVNMPKSQDALGLSRAQVAADPRQADASALQFNTRKSLEQTQTGLVFEHKFDGADSMRVAAYAGTRHIVQYQAIPTGTQVAATSPGGVIDLQRDYAGVDARWIHRGYLNDGAYTLTAGFNMDTLDEGRKGYQNFLGPSATPTALGVQGALRRNENNTATTFDQYVQGEWQFYRGWRLSAGIRNSRVSIVSRDSYIVAGNGDDSGSTAYRATTPVAGLVREINENVNVYATAARGFETPTLNEISYSPGGSGLNFNLRPSISKQYEAGVKMHFGRTLLNAALFSTRTQNEIVVLTNSGGRSVYQNAGRTSREGAELSAEAQLGAGFSAYFAYTFVNARYRQDFFTCLAAPCTVPTVLVPSGNRMPGVAQNSAYGELAWRAREAGGARAALEMRMVGSVPVDDRNTDAAPGYTIFNARIGWEQRSQAWTLSEFARVDNIGNHQYVGSILVNDANGRFFEPAPGRNYTVGMSASYKFW
ncbi:MAG: TonB-dependent receptor [Betaproteobacteria bacterium]|nr:TonB-dependent receptor [Betaproteobacteria bacterium]